VGLSDGLYLVTLAVAAVLYFLDRPLLTQAAFVAAVAAAVVASYSSLQGLIVWPVGLLLLYFRRRSKQQLIAWCTLALLTAVLYFYHLNPSEYSDQTYVFTHPIASLKFLLFLLGSILGVQLTNHSGAEIAFGGVLLRCQSGSSSATGDKTNRQLDLSGLLWSSTECSSVRVSLRDGPGSTSGPRLGIRYVDCSPSRAAIWYSLTAREQQIEVPQPRRR